MLRPMPRGVFIRGFAVLAVCALLVNAGVAYLAVKRLIEGDRWVSHTYQVLEHLDRLTSLLEDAEANHRSFILTSDPAYLERFTVDGPLIWQQYEGILRLTADNSVQQQRLSELKPLISQRMALFEGVLDARAHGGIDAARELMSHNQNRQLMERIGGAIGSLQQEELRLLRERDIRAERSARNAYITLSIATVLALLFLAAMLQLLRQERHARMGAEQALQRLTWALQAAEGGAWDWDLKNDTAVWSPEMYELWGVQPGTPQNRKTSLELVDERDREPLEATLNEAVKTHVDGRFEFRINHPESGERWMSSYVRPFYAEDGTPERMLGVTLDVTASKRAERQMKLTTELLEQFVEQAPAALAMFDRDMRYVMASKRWCDDCGVTSHSIIGRSHYDVFPDLPLHWREEHKRALAGEIRNGEEDWTALDGNKHAIRWEIHPWGDSGHDTGGIMIFLEDVTERKKAEDDLRASEERYRVIFENASVGVAQLSLDGTYLFVNHRFSQQLGYQDGELVGRDFRETTHPEDLPAEMDLLDQMLRGETDGYLMEKRYLRKNGGDIWASINRSIGRDENGNPKYFVSVVEDITRRKHAEAVSADLMESLRQSEETFRAIYENASIGIEQVGLDGSLRMVNAALCKMLGYSPDELRTKTFAEITHPEDLVRENELLDQLLRGARPEYGIDKRYLRRDGSPVWVHVHSGMARDEQGQPAFRISVIQDITDRKRAEQAMRMAERISAANKLAAALAHEIVNSLMAIGNVFHLLDIDPAVPADAKEMLAVAQQELGHVDQITKRALMVNRAGKTSERVALPAMLDGIIDLYVSALRRSRVKVETRYRIDGDTVLDTGVLKQAFTNLLTNAIDAMPAGGRLRIDAYPSRNWGSDDTPGVRLVVADTGTGIAEEHMARLFDPFFTTKDERGTGLGLWVTRGLLVTAGGNIRIRTSQKEGHKGTCVSVFLPCTFGAKSAASGGTGGIQAR